MNEPVEWKNYRGQYLGLAEATKTGTKKDGTQWVRNKLLLTHVDGKQVRFSTFQDISQLILGQQYHVLFKEEVIPLPDGTQGKSKTAVKITPHTDMTKPLGFDQPPQQQAPVQAPVQQPMMPQPIVHQAVPVQQLVTQTPLDIDPQRFAEAYRDNGSKPISEKTLPDFVGNFIKQTNKPLYDNLSKLFDTVVQPNTDKQDNK